MNPDPTSQAPKHHFLVIAAASRGARLFTKKALRQGHSVTALCRAVDDKAALERMEKILAETSLTVGEVAEAHVPGGLQASCLNILEAQTYEHILTSHASIDRVCCFVGVTGMRQMMSRSVRLYTQTIRALIEGMRASRWVEFFYHGSSGLEGPPGESTNVFICFQFNFVGNSKAISISHHSISICFVKFG